VVPKKVVPAAALPTSSLGNDDDELSVEFISEPEGGAAEEGDFSLGMYINFCYISFLIRVCNYGFDCYRFCLISFFFAD
jgi:hypothetical protein